MDKGEARRAKPRCMERVTWKFTVTNVKWILGIFLYASVNTNTQGHCDSLELWDGEDNRREVQEERDLWRMLVAV